RSRSHGRLAVCGEALRDDSALACPKPPSPVGVVAISAPPAMIRSALPYVMQRPPNPSACVEVVQAVTTPRLGPRNPKRIDRWPEIMLMMVEGTKNGEILRGLRPESTYAAQVSSIVHRPPMPAPVTTPQRSRLSRSKSRP